MGSRAEGPAVVSRLAMLRAIVDCILVLGSSFMMLKHGMSGIGVVRRLQSTPEDFNACNSKHRGLTAGCNVPHDA
jgi:hypothetical protein